MPSSTPFLVSSARIFLKFWYVCSRMYLSCILGEPDGQEISSQKMYSLTCHLHLLRVERFDHILILIIVCCSYSYMSIDRCLELDMIHEFFLNKEDYKLVQNFFYPTTWYLYDSFPLVFWLSIKVLHFSNSNKNIEISRC